MAWARSWAVERDHGAEGLDEWVGNAEDQGHDQRPARKPELDRQAAGGLGQRPSVGAAAEGAEHGQLAAPHLERPRRVST